MCTAECHCTSERRLCAELQMESIAESPQFHCFVCLDTLEAMALPRPHINVLTKCDLLPEGARLPIVDSVSS